MAGTYSVAVLLAGKHIQGSPFVLNVLPAEPHAPSCLCYGRGMATAMAGETAELSIEARDRFGNARGEGGALFQVVVVGPGARGIEHRAAVMDCEDGKYEVRYRIDQVGRYVLHATLDGEHVQGSPSKLIVSGARSHPPACAVLDAPSEEQVACTCSGVPYSFVVEARDDFGNPRMVGGDKFQVHVPTLTRTLTLTQATTTLALTLTLARARARARALALALALGLALAVIPNPNRNVSGARERARHRHAVHRRPWRRYPHRNAHSRQGGRLPRRCRAIYAALPACNTCYTTLTILVSSSCNTCKTTLTTHAPSA